MSRSTVRPSRRIAVALAACTVAAVAACADVTSPAAGTPAAASASIAPDAPSGEDAALPAAVRRALAATRAATARYHDDAVAIADGYAPMGGCVANPVAGVGGMGVHYVNVPLLLDPSLDPERPEVLVYEPQQNGRMRLVAVEWMAFAAAYPGGAPEIFGQRLENGPPLPGGPGGALVPTYALHAWTWRHNPSGMLNAWNPAVSCQYEQPGGTPANAAAGHQH
ncbi:MAG TPA: hypothetical protein VEZ47_07850 [Gemmatirosa sp.]|nr:hypothetical protein [Gemmatirosa sp.]